MTDFMAKIAPNSISAGAPPQTPPAGAAYSAPDPLAVFGGLLLREGYWRRGEGGEGREESVPIVPVLRNDHCITVLAPSDFSALKTLYDNLCTKLVHSDFTTFRPCFVDSKFVTQNVFSSPTRNFFI